MANTEATSPTLARPEEKPYYSVDEALAFLPVCRSGAYAAIARGDLPSIKVGRRVVIPTAALRRWLGIDPPLADASDAE